MIDEASSNLRQTVGSLEMLTAELKEANRRIAQYRDMVAHSNDHIVVIDANAICRAVNEAYLIANGIKWEDVCGRPVEELTGHPFFEAETGSYIRRCLAGEPLHIRKWYCYRALGRRCMDITYYAARDTMDQAASVILVARDVTEIIERQILTEFSSEREDLLSSAIQQTPVGIIILGAPEGKLLLLNAEAERILGLTQKELTGRNFYDSYGLRGGSWVCLHSDRTPYSVEELSSYRSLTEGKVIRNAVMILQRHTGEEFWIAVNSTPIKSRSGKLIGIFTVFSDVTRSKLEQERIRANEERLNYALTAAYDGLWEWNLETGEGYCSPRYYSMLGYEDGEFPGDTEAWKQLIHSDDLETVLATLEAMRKDHTTNYEAVYRMRCKDGDYRWILSHALAVEHNAAGIPLRMVGTHKDITEHRRMEMELRQSRDELEAKVAERTRELLETNSQLESIFNLSSESIWVSDHEGNVLKVNRASEKLLEIRADEIVGRNIRDLMDGDLMDRSATLEVLATKRQVSMLQYVPRTGRQLLVTGTPIFNEKGEISLVTVVERDLTELNRLKEELERSQSVSSRFQQELNELKRMEVEKRRVVAESPKLQNVLRTAIKLASQNISNILILGESGTGKGMLAKLIHENSPRRNGPFIEINCATLPETLLEAELFGYEKGAFTGAREQGKAGLFELAQEGTLFLDEVGDLPLPLQAKLLKYLDSHSIMHLGGLKPITIDCNIVAATNIDLESQVWHGRFRKDLYYRLNAFTVTIPPLRERREDILELTRHFIEQYSKQFRTRKRLSPGAFDLLQNHPFPGNVRELKALIKKAVVLSEENLLDDIILENVNRHQLVDPSSGATAERGVMSLKDQLLAHERQVLEGALNRCRSTYELARYLKTSQSSIVRRLKKHKLPKRRKSLLT